LPKADIIQNTNTLQRTVRSRGGLLCIIIVLQ
jgi:hypothetical protein